MYGRPVPRLLYHGTNLERALFIIEHGLDPIQSNSDQDAVYFTDRELAAEDYARRASLDENHQDLVIFCVRLDDLDYGLLGPDESELQEAIDIMGDESILERGGFHWSEASWIESLQICEQVAYHGHISAGLLEIIEGEDLVLDSLMVEKVEDINGDYIPMIKNNETKLSA